jgi:5-methylcytosine-specific restriction endonuclease McrA
MRMWQRIRLNILARDKHRCVICGSTKRLGVHHLDGSGDQHHNTVANNDEKNLVTLCMSCHNKLHWEMVRKQHKKNLYELIGRLPIFKEKDRWLMSY